MKIYASLGSNEITCANGFRCFLFQFKGSKCNLILFPNWLPSLHLKMCLLTNAKGLTPKNLITCSPF